MHARIATILMGASLLGTPAHAWQWTGNPTLTLWVDREVTSDLDSADVGLGEVRVHRCEGGYDAYPVDDEVDLVEGLSVSIEGGDLCGVSVWFDTALVIRQSADGFQYTFQQLSKGVVLDAEVGPYSAALTPVAIEVGPLDGLGPSRLYVDIN